MKKFIPVANGLVHELRRDCAIDTAADSADNATLGATNLSNTGNFLPNELFLDGGTIIAPVLRRQKREETHHSPVRGALANIENESSDNLLASDGVGDFRVELDAIDGLVVVSEGGVGGGIGMANNVEVLRGLGELVSVRHPDLKSINTSREGKGPRNAIFTSISSPRSLNRASTCPFPNLLTLTLAKPYSRWSHLVTSPPRFQAISCKRDVSSDRATSKVQQTNLQTIADTQDRDTEIKHRRVDMW